MEHLDPFNTELRAALETTLKVTSAVYPEFGYLQETGKFDLEKVKLAQHNHVVQSEALETATANNANLEAVRRLIGHVANKSNWELYDDTDGYMGCDLSTWQLNISGLKEMVEALPAEVVAWATEEPTQ